MKKILTITGSILLVLIIAVLIASFFIEEPLRRYIVEQANQRLDQYTISIKKLDLHPLTLTADLKGVTVRDKTEPKALTSEVGTLEADLELSSIVKGRAVADVSVDGLRLNLDLKTLETKYGEKKRPAKSFQEVLKSIYPFEIDEFKISNGKIAVSGPEKMPPITVENIRFSARNIRNIQESDAAYPSPFHLEASVFEKGSVTVDGKANIMLPEYPGIQANFVIDQVPIASFDIIAGRMFNLDIDKGLLHVEGRIEYAPESKSVSLDQVLLKEARVDYYFTGEPEKARVPEKGKRPRTPLFIKEIRIKNSEFGLINKAAKPDYRVFISNVNASLTDFSTGFTKGPAKLDLHGMFMGTGQSDLYGTFRSEKQGPDFDLRVAIRNTKMPAMNNVFRAYGSFDIAAGKFSFFSELHVRNNKVDGYVKPLFKDITVYDERQDEEKEFFEQAYEMIAGGLSELLENPRESVATKAPVAGKLKSPQLDTWTAIVNLVQNAFFHSILPGFAQNIGNS